MEFCFSVESVVINFLTEFCLRCHWLEAATMQAYSSFPSEKVSPAGILGVGVREGKEEEKEGGRDEEKGVEAVDVMMERREAVDDGPTDGVVAFAFPRL